MVSYSLGSDALVPAGSVLHYGPSAASLAPFTFAFLQLELALHATCGCRDPHQPVRSVMAEGRLHWSNVPLWLAADGGVGDAVRSRMSPLLPKFSREAIAQLTSEANARDGPYRSSLLEAGASIIVMIAMDPVHLRPVTCGVLMQPASVSARDVVLRQHVDAPALLKTWMAALEAAPRVPHPPPAAAGVAAIDSGILTINADRQLVVTSIDAANAHTITLLPPPPPMAQPRPAVAEAGAGAAAAAAGAAAVVASIGASVVEEEVEEEAEEEAESNSDASSAASGLGEGGEGDESMQNDVSDSGSEKEDGGEESDDHDDADDDGSGDGGAMSASSAISKPSPSPSSAGIGTGAAVILSAAAVAAVPAGTTAQNTPRFTKPVSAVAAAAVVALAAGSKRQAMSPDTSSPAGSGVTPPPKKGRADAPIVAASAEAAGGGGVGGGEGDTEAGWLVRGRIDVEEEEKDGDDASIPDNVSGKEQDNDVSGDEAEGGYESSDESGPYRAKRARGRSFRSQGGKPPKKPDLTSSATKGKQQKQQQSVELSSAGPPSLSSVLLLLRDEIAADSTAIASLLELVADVLSADPSAIQRLPVALRAQLVTLLAARLAPPVPALDPEAASVPSVVPGSAPARQPAPPSPANGTFSPPFPGGSENP